MSPRPAVEADCARLAQIHAESFSAPWSQAEIKTLLGVPGGFGLVCEEGFLLGRAIGGEAEILTLAVRPAERRKGRGAALVEAAAGLATVAGCSVLFLEVATDNAAAVALYSTLGFVRAGLRPGYYRRGEGTADALVLRRDLTP